MKINFHIADSATPPFIGICTEDADDLVQIPLPIDAASANQLAKVVVDVVQKVNQTPSSSPLAALVRAYELLAVTASVKDFLEDLGNWGLTEAEDTLARALAQAIATMQAQTTGRRPSTEKERSGARAEYASDDLCIDDDALVSEADNGVTWVQAWVRRMP